MLSQDCVRVDIGDGSVITKRLEEIRLMESRKSARLVNSDTDFSLLADFNIVEQRRLAQARDTEQTEAGGSSGGASRSLPLLLLRFGHMCIISMVSSVYVVNVNF